MALRIPRSVRVGPYDFTVSLGGRGWARHLAENATEQTAEQRESEILFGRTDTVNARIGVAPGQSIDSRRDTLLHEVLHACYFIGGGFPDGDSETEEASIRVLSPVLLTVIRDNPDLLAYLRGCPVD